MSPSRRIIYEFGPFRLDSVRRLLARDGEAVPLTPKTLDLLLTLVRNRGQTVSKEELLRRIWPRTAVEESNLTQNVFVPPGHQGRLPAGPNLRPPALPRLHRGHAGEVAQAARHDGAEHPQERRSRPQQQQRHERPPAHQRGAGLAAERSVDHRPARPREQPHGLRRPRRDVRRPHDPLRGRARVTHGPVETDSRYVDLLIDTIQNVSAQMKTFVAQGLSQDAAVAKVDFSGVESRFTHGDPFLKKRFQDYVAGGALATAAYLVETGKGPSEVF